MNADTEMNRICRDNVDVLRAQGMGIAPFDEMDFYASGYCNTTSYMWFYFTDANYSSTHFFIVTPVETLSKPDAYLQIPTNQIIPSSECPVVISRAAEYEARRRGG